VLLRPQTENFRHLGVGVSEASGNGGSERQLTIGADRTVVSQTAGKTFFFADDNPDEGQPRAAQGFAAGGKQAFENDILGRARLENRQHLARSARLQCCCANEDSHGEKPGHQDSEAKRQRQSMPCPKRR
jgi:hypothetical protein